MDVTGGELIAGGQSIERNMMQPGVPAQRIVSRVGLESAVAAVVILLLAPLLALIVALVMLDSPGPALFRQNRTGLNGRAFRIYKFRTMRVQEDGADVVQVRRGDARVTRVGAFLRRTSLDELPQLVNVLRGEMAFSGPRPHALAHDAYYGELIPNYQHRFRVRPGITGWAQINGSRGETPTVMDMEKRIVLDLWYVANASAVLDIKIIVLTALSLTIRKSDAY